MKIRLFSISQWLINLLVIINVTIAQNPETPYITLLPAEIRQDLGKSVYVLCDPQVKNPDLVSNVEWRNPRGEIIQTGEDLSISTLTSDGGPHQLGMMITSLKKEDVGNYTCSAFYATNQKLSATIQVLSQKSIDFKDTETLQTPVFGSDAKIRCVVSADPSPTIDWTKDGKALVKSDKHYIQQNDGILIKNIQESDEGIYRCRARVALLGEIKSKDIQVEVHMSPEITGAPKDTEGVEKDSVAFQCIAKGKPAPKYKWVNKDSEVLNDKEGYYVDEITGELRILDLRPDHAGTYRCKAYNNAGEIFAEAKLRVLMKPKIEQLLNITKSVTSEAELRCTISGDPVPDAIFRKEVNEEPYTNGVNSDDRIQVIQELDDQGRRVGRLVFNDLQRKDDGLYSCKGNSTGGISEAWGHITVEFPPTFDEQPYDDFWSWEQKPVNLTCLATSIPNATIQWFQREEPIRIADQNLKILAHGPNGILNVTPLDGSYFDTYTCKATNTLGTAEHKVTLKQVQKPGPLSSAQVEKKTATTVSWSIRDPLNDGGRPVIGYLTQFRLHNDPWDKNPQTEYWTKGSEQNYVIDELTPLAKYVFRFAARNDVGDGEWSGDKSVEMPKRSSPEEPLIFSIKYPEVKEIPYIDHYDLQWQVPLDNGEPMDFFQIIYYTVKELPNNKWERLGSQSEERVDYPGKSTFKLTGLSSDSFYKIELRAHNKIGFSTPAEGVIKTAYDPSSAPKPGTREHTSGSDSTSRLNAAVQPATPSPSQGNSGVIVAIVVVLLLILLIILDVVCFFLKNVGVTATLVRKCCAKPSEKDKEAMIEEGVKENVKIADVDKSTNVTEKESDATETTPMITTGESDKEAILKEEQEQQKQGEDSPAADEIKKSESKNSITKDSSV